MVVRAKFCQEGTIVAFWWGDQRVIGYVSWNHLRFPEVFVTVPGPSPYESKILRLEGDRPVDVLMNPHELAHEYVRKHYGNQPSPANAMSVTDIV